MGKLYGSLLAIIGVIASIFFANQSGKKKGKEEEKQKQNEEVLKSVISSKKSSDSLRKLSRDELIDKL